MREKLHTTANSAACCKQHLLDTKTPQSTTNGQFIWSIRDSERVVPLGGSEAGLIADPWPKENMDVLNCWMVQNAWLTVLTQGRVSSRGEWPYSMAIFISICMIYPSIILPQGSTGGPLGWIHPHRILTSKKMHDSNSGTSCYSLRKREKIPDSSVLQPKPCCVLTDCFWWMVKL